MAVTAEKYGSMPAYGAGYSIGYTAAGIITPVADLIELIPLVGSVVSGVRDGAEKSDIHYQGFKAICTESSEKFYSNIKDSLAKDHVDTGYPARG